MFSLPIDDHHAYLNWLEKYSEEHQVDVLTYCLMANHIHLVVVPTTEDGLNRVLKPLHMQLTKIALRVRMIYKVLEK